LPISIPSISIKPPFYNSSILDKDNAIVDFPAPVLPTMPTFYPGSILNVRFYKTVFVSGLYYKLAFLNSTAPFCGHYSGTLISS
jgi:hypothetical protein